MLSPSRAETGRPAADWRPAPRSQDAGSAQITHPARSNEAMALDISQHQLDRADLVVLVGHDGLVEWSASRSRGEVVTMLRGIADDIEDETL